MKRLLTFAALLLLASCRPYSQETYLDWLYDSMPLPDSLGYPRSYWEANVTKTLEVRKLQNWKIPEREFRHFVLPLRVNNETLDDFRTLYADTLCARVKGMDLAAAALEINHWCHEQAVYSPSDARTSSPTATMRNGVGRCGEESVLTVAAMRAAGIPARQVYTPRWAHTDDNHAWVEVWVDGKWHFLGACEPEPRLDMGWFNAPVSRAMLLHTKVFGQYDGPEDVISRSACYTEINVIRGYVPARKTCVTVLDTLGCPVAGANVGFKIYNYGEFYTVAWYSSDKNGRVSLDTGCGDIFVWASDGDRFGYAVAGGEENTVTLSHRIGEEFSDNLLIVPPVENPLESGAGADEIELNGRRLAYEDSVRASHPHGNPDLENFLSKGGDRALEVVGMVTEKDRKDVREEVLEDALLVDSDDPYVLCPRVGHEELRPFRAGFRDAGLAFAGPLEIAAWVRDSIKVIDGRNPQGLAIPPVCVLESRVCDRRSLGVFFVAACRACGFAARVDEVTGKTQYRDGGEWIDVAFDSQDKDIPVNVPDGIMKLTSSNDLTPMYYRHFTLARIDGGKDMLLEFGADSDTTPVSEFEGGVALDEGYYSLTTGRRMADGSVLASLTFFRVREGETTSVPVVLRKSEGDVAVIGSMDADRFLSVTGRGYFLLAVMGDKDEPTSHTRIELESISGFLNEWGRPLVILSHGKESSGTLSFLGADGAVESAGSVGLLGSVASETISANGLLKNVAFGIDPDDSVLKMILSACQSASTALPVITICDSFGRIVYFSQGYNTSLGSDLQSVISRL